MGCTSLLYLRRYFKKTFPFLLTFHFMSGNPVTGSMLSCVITTVVLFVKLGADFFHLAPGSMSLDLKA